LLFKSAFVLYFNIKKKGNFFMKKGSILIVSILILGLIFAGCGDIANITTPSDVDSLEKNSSPIAWTGQGSNALKCELIGTSDERTEEGWIRWTLNQAKNVTDAELVLGGGGSGSYEPTKVTPGGVYEFFTPYFDVEGLTAVVNYLGELKNKAQFVIADYCPGGDDGDPCEGNTGPSISITNKTIDAGDTLSYVVDGTTYIASDDNTNGTPSFSLGLEPSGMTINSSTGEITWVTDCEDAGTYNVQVTITDACGVTDYDTFDLTVNACTELWRIVLTWGEDVDDLDAVLISSEGAQAKYGWSTDPNVAHSGDDTSYGGTETITIYSLTPGTIYYIFVEDFYERSILSSSGATVTVYDDTDTLVETFDVTGASGDPAYERYCKVFTMDDSGTITSVNELTDTDPYSIPW
jgi:hypothetical protein